MKPWHGFFVAALVVGLFLHSSVSVAAEAPLAKPQNSRPNVVFVLTDDLDIAATKPFYDKILSNTLREIKQPGVEFSNAFVVNPLCCPSRASILSGKYPHNTDVYNNGTFANNDVVDDPSLPNGKYGGRDAFLDDEPTALANRLYQAGYRTFISGKYLNGFKAQPKDPALREPEPETMRKLITKVIGVLNGKNIFDLPYNLNISPLAKDWEIAPLPIGWSEGMVLTDELLGRRMLVGYNYTALHWENGRPVDEKKWDRQTTAEGSHNWQADARMARHGLQDQDYSTDVVFNKTIEFLQKAKTTNDAQPFFAYVNPTCPHSPLSPARRHKDKLKEIWADGLPFWSHNHNSKHPLYRGNYYQDGETLADKPSWLAATWKDRKKYRDGRDIFFKKMGAETAPEPSREAKREYFRAQGGRPLSNQELDAIKIPTGWNENDMYNRLGSMLACDEGVASVVKWLKENNEWNNTVFIFTSDNGYNLGAHGLNQKDVPYEESLHIPMYIAGGTQTGIRAGVVDDNWVLTIDLAPTILDFAGVSVPGDVDGISLKPILTSGGVNGRNDFLVEFRNNNLVSDNARTWDYVKALNTIPSYKAVRRKCGNQASLAVEWVRYGERPQGEATNSNYASAPKEYEFYDMNSDPYQLTNLRYHTSGSGHQCGSEDEYQKSMQRMRELEKCKGSECR